MNIEELETYDLGEEFSMSSFRDSNIAVVKVKDGKFLLKSDVVKLLNQLEKEKRALKIQLDAANLGWA